MKAPTLGLVLLLAGALATIGACGSGDSTVLSLDDYDTSCADSGDCRAVFIGDVCPCMGCDNAAINQSELERYSADVADARDACDEDMMCDAMSCALGQATCNAGRCELEPWSGSGGSGNAGGSGNMGGTGGLNGGGGVGGYTGGADSGSGGAG